MYLNKIQLIGNLTKSPELKALPSGTKVVNITVATNRTWKDAQGEKKEDVEFHNVIAFGKHAETIKQYFNKGDQIYVEGRLQTRSWEVDGSKRYMTEIVLENFQFGRKSDKKVVDEETGEEVPDINDIPSVRELSDEQKATMTVDEVADMSDIPF